MRSTGRHLFSTGLSRLRRFPYRSHAKGASTTTSILPEVPTGKDGAERQRDATRLARRGSEVLPRPTSDLAPTHEHPVQEQQQQRPEDGPDQSSPATGGSEQ